MKTNRKKQQQPPTISIILCNFAKGILNAEKMNQKEIFDNIMSRTSVRSFLDQPVESEKVEMLLHAAMAAPSACNKQPWHFAVIDDRKLLDQIPHFSP